MRNEKNRGENVVVATRLPKPEAQRLAEVAAASERTVAQEVRHLVKRHLAAQEVSGRAA